MERKMAERTMKGLLRLFPPLNDLTELSMQLPTKDARAMRRHLGAIMGEVYDLVQPIVREFPDLNPDKDTRG